MQCRTLLFAVTLLGHVDISAADEDIILMPVYNNASLPERLMVLMPGGLVPNEHYRLTGEAIQNATTGVRLTVVIPEVFQKLCIITCPSTYACAPLKSRVDAAVAKSGFKSKNPKEDTFLAGHSLGATCANFLVQGYHYEFAGLLEFGGYVDMTGSGSIANYSIPVLHMAGELDGGGARPSSMAGLYLQSKGFASTHGEDASLKLKPVQVLEGLDHSDFCPGFFVTKTKDCKSEVSQDVALKTIGTVASAFLHLNAPTSGATQAAAMSTMKSHLEFTKQMVDGYLSAWEIEKGEASQAEPWCDTAQNKIAGLTAQDAPKFKAQPCKLITAGLHEFEHQHTKCNLTDSTLECSCFSAIEPPASSIDHSQFASKSVDCKMVDATLVGQQLKVTTNASVQCADINREAFDVAKKLVPAKSLKRFEEKGRTICFMPDTAVLGNIGPLWVKSEVTLTETKDCLQVASSGLNSSIASPIFPGNHYCKLLSPSLAMDWIMTDSHKPFPYPSTADSLDTILI